MNRHMNVYTLALTRQREALADGILQVFRALGNLVAKAYRTYRAAQRRRAAIRHLREFDDRLLRDIGLSRYEIPTAVNGLASDGHGSPSGRSLRRIAGDSVGALSRAIRTRNRSRITARQLRRVDHKLLADIGYKPDDIDCLASDLAERSLTTASAANTNQRRAAA